VNLLDHRLLVVLGKGGVGRTTMTAALGVAAHQLGKRACVVEIADGALAAKLGLGGRSYAFRRTRSGVDVWSMTVPECLEEFARRKLSIPSFATSVLRNRFVDTFIDAVPGLNDLLLLGKLENLITEPLPSDPVYDVMILDAPATGHGLTLLQSAKTMAEITRAGPFHDLADTIGVFLADPVRTGVALVTLPEELPVQETLELAGSLRIEGYRVDAVIANLVEASPLPSPPGAEQVLDVLRAMPDGEPLAALVVNAEARAKRHQAALDRLGGGLGQLGLERVLHTSRHPTVDAIGQELADQLGGAA
jgi:anion-transporting  ArsA/GET3 family ATPase